MQQFPTMLRPFAHPAACCWELLRKQFETGQTLSACKQTQQFPTMLASCWSTILRPFAHPVGSCCIVGSCCAKFETGQTLSYAQTDANIPNNVRPFAHPVVCCCVVGSCCAKFETGQTLSYVQTDATIPNNVGELLADDVASVCT